MKAKIKPRIQLENREDLSKSIPLKTPWVIFVDPSDMCNFNCRFCPTGNLKLMKEVGRPLKLMNWNVYKKIIDDICQFDKPIKVLRLYKDGEPLMNPLFSAMVNYAKSSGCCERVDTTTNASLLSKKLNLEIINAGLDRINISVEGINTYQYKDFSNYCINFNKFVENIKHFYKNRKQCEMIIKIPGDYLTKKEKESFFKIFGNICDGISIEHTMNCWNNFKMKGMKQNEEVGIYGQSIEKIDVCPYVFYSISINSDGTVSLCFLDWNRKFIIGDITKESLENIWNGERLNNIRINFLKQKDKFFSSICSNCSQLSHGMAVNLDPHRKELLKRFLK